MDEKFQMKCRLCSLLPCNSVFSGCIYLLKDYTLYLVRSFVSIPECNTVFLFDIKYLAASSLDFLNLKESVVPTECLRYVKVARCLALFEVKEKEFDIQSRPLFLIYSFRHSQSS